MKTWINLTTRDVIRAWEQPDGYVELTPEVQAQLDAEDAAAAAQAAAEAQAEHDRIVVAELAARAWLALGSYGNYLTSQFGALPDWPRPLPVAGQSTTPNPTPQQLAAWYYAQGGRPVSQQTPIPAGFRAGAWTITLDGSGDTVSAVCVPVNIADEQAAQAALAALGHLRHPLPP